MSKNRILPLKVATELESLNIRILSRRVATDSWYDGVEFNRFLGYAKLMLARFFIWWREATVGTLFDVKRRSMLIGSDEYGNQYYEDRKPSVSGRHRRYVIYKGLAEPSKVPADWHGWLHHTFEHPPTVEPLSRRSWEIDHSPNMTGTPYAEKPTGSLSNRGVRQKADSDYEAWDPNA